MQRSKPTANDKLLSTVPDVRLLPLLIIKPTRCTNFLNLFWNKTLHVLDSSSVYHQEFFTVHTAMVYVILKCHKWVKLLCIYVYIVVKIVKHVVDKILGYIKS